MMESKTANMKVDSVLHAVLENLGGIYKHVKHLGGGEFFNVHLIQHKVSNEYHALKIMDYHLIRRLLKEGQVDGRDRFNEIKKRFISEAKMYGKINHRHIVKIQDTGFILNESDNIEIPFIIMNYIKGASLAHVLKKEAPFEINRALAIAKSLLSVIDVIHQHYIIHRDIKPANIMIEGETGEAILIDFGIAKNILDDPCLTRTGAFLGSPVYMAPEQFIDSSKVGPEIDTYALGVVLYEMLTGEPPYKGNSLAEIMGAHREKPVPNARDMNPTLPPGIEDILFKAMAKNPHHRYRNAKEFLYDLQDIAKAKKNITRKKKNKWIYFFYLFIILVIVALIFIKPWAIQMITGRKMRRNLKRAYANASRTVPTEIVKRSQSEISTPASSSSNNSIPILKTNK
ncbi:MAG: serine/threonine protein kinase [Acidobacteria bacterium]|nr:serine/threonine protein kinase [Acidobacteriota bacterium]